MRCFASERAARTLSPSAIKRRFPPIAARKFKRSLFGLRPKDVEAAIAGLESELRSERDKVGALEKLAADAKELSTELERASLDLAARVNQLEEVSTRLAERVVERDREIDALRAQLAEKAQAVMAERDLDEADAAIDAVSAVETGDVFEGKVEVEVGPLSDFAQLVGFEDAANEIDATEEISVRGFAGGRATLELHLSEPVELLRELEERAPFDFRVRDTRNDRVVLDLEGEQAA